MAGESPWSSYMWVGRRHLSAALLETYSCRLSHRVLGSPRGASPRLLQAQWPQWPWVTERGDVLLSGQSCVMPSRWFSGSSLPPLGVHHSH